MLLPRDAIIPWLFVLVPVVAGACAYWLVSRIYRTHPGPTTYAKITDDVPGLSEFPLAYGYLFASLTLFVACLYAATQSVA